MNTDGKPGPARKRRPFNRNKLATDLDELRESVVRLSERAGKLRPDLLAAPLDEIVRTARGIEARYGDGQPQRTQDGSAPPLVVFVHIPRTAGSTLSKILGLRHGAGYVWGGNLVVGVERGRLIRKGAYEQQPGRLRRRAAFVASITERASLMQGHIPLGLRPVFPQGSRHFTFLREPSSRTLSHYHYFLARARRSAKAGGHPIPATLTLSEYLRSAERPEDGLDLLAPDNLQTRMLSGSPLNAPASKRMLDKAKRNLAKLDMVGITEQFGTSVALLHHVYGWKLLLPPARRYKATSRSPATEDVEAARELNALDDQLYAEGLALFEHAAAAFGSQVEIDAAAMTRAWEIVGATEDAAAVGDDRRAQRIDARAREILADTRALLATELTGVSRRAERLVSYGEVLADARAAMLDAGDRDLDDYGRKLDEESLADARGVTDGLEEHAKNLAADMRSLGNRRGPSAAPPAESDELVSVESAPLD